MRILAIDPGDRRIGLAISDELGITAQGLDTFDKRGAKDFFGHVAKLIADFEVREIVVGDPIHLSGKPSESSDKARALAKELQRRFDVEVTLWDERLSSEEAKRVLRGSRPKKGTVDRLAAIIILQTYLDFKGRRS
ncbi:MAG: Holliday junction resolvase RuvX [Candidatus Krumholzibacteria bacterium]|nr:Holliday junction resolvase RuvX [Candidatus Krumholzibacteria bacterium]